MITWERCISQVRKFWLVGEFLGNPRAARLAAFYELLFAFLVGTIPFWIGGVVVLAVEHADVKGDANWLTLFWVATKGTFEKGELLIFAVSLIAPVFWLVAYEPENAKPLAHRRPIIVTAAFISILCGALYGLVQAKVVADPQFVYAVSCYSVLAAMGVMYLALTYHIFRLPPVVDENLFVSQQTDLLEQVANRRGDQ